MSAGIALPQHVAYLLGEKIARLLQPHAVRVKALGSLRRRRPLIGDLDFIIEPRMIAIDLFGTLVPDLGPVREVLRELGTWVKGGDRMIQITDVAGYPGFNLELHICWPPAQWGSLCAIYTGPRELSHRAMDRLRRRGFRHEEGRVLRGWDVVPTSTEEEYFALAEIPFVPPARRDELAAELEAGRTPQFATRT